MTAVRFTENTTLPLRLVTGETHPAWRRDTDPAAPSYEPGAVQYGQFIAGEVATFTETQGQALVAGGLAVYA